MHAWTTFTKTTAGRGAATTGEPLREDKGRGRVRFRVGPGESGRGASMMSGGWECKRTEADSVDGRRMFTVRAFGHVAARPHQDACAGFIQHAAQCDAGGGQLVELEFW